MALYTRLNESSLMLWFRSNLRAYRACAQLRHTRLENFEAIICHYSGASSTYNAILANILAKNPNSYTEHLFQNISPCNKHFRHISAQ